MLYGRKTTSLAGLVELAAWALAGFYLGDYYRTYPRTVEDELRCPHWLQDDRAAATAVG